MENVQRSTYLRFKISSVLSMIYILLGTYFFVIQARGNDIMHGYVGVVCKDSSPQLTKFLGDSIIVVDVVRDSPAEKAGLKKWDVIIEFDGQAVKNAKWFHNRVMRSAPGTKAKLTLLRSGQRKTLTITLGKRESIQLRNPGKGRVQTLKRELLELDETLTMARGGTALAYVASAFYGENQRWPETLDELKTFYTNMPEHHVQIDWEGHEYTLFFLSSLGDDSIKIVLLPEGPEQDKRHSRFVEVEMREAPDVEVSVTMVGDETSEGITASRLLKFRKAFPLTMGAEIACVAYLFYSNDQTWPRTLDELKTFHAKTGKRALAPGCPTHIKSEQYEEVSFSSQPDGSLRIDLKMKGTPGVESVLTLHPKKSGRHPKGSTTKTE